MNLNIKVGNLVADPETLSISSGSACKFRIAVRENYTAQDGSHPTSFYNVMCWNKLAENCLKFLKKGNKVLVIGRDNLREFEKDGQKKYVFEIVANQVEFLSSNKETTELKPTDESLPF